MYRLTCCVRRADCRVARSRSDKPNTLTPKEIADGWLLLFDGETHVRVEDRRRRRRQGRLADSGDGTKKTTATRQRDFGP